MQSHAEWGEYFPMHYSVFPYNESAAMMSYPLTVDQAKHANLSWSERTDAVQAAKMILAEQLPDHIKDIPDDIVHWGIQCDVTGRPFRITQQELALYRRLGLPVPRYHHDERYQRRMALINPFRLHDRTCTKCGKGIQSTFTGDREEQVYCEECYLKEVY